MNFLSHPILYFSFKKITYLLVLLPVLVFSQSTDQNYIKTVIYKDSTVASIPNPSPSQALVNVTYMDGLGRPIQQVSVQQSSIGQNIVTPITYDSFGRQDKDYLPVPMSSTSLNYTDNLTVVSDPTSYYSNTFGSDGDYRYAEKRFESSPLNRVMEQGAPGEDWQLGNGHTIKMEYQTNTATEVKLYKAVATYNPVTLLYDVVLSQPSPHYPAQSLYKSIVKDENWTSGTLNTTEEFKNKEGQVILKRTYNTISGDTKAHDTYYVYDQFGNLSFVIPPLADNPSNTTILNNLCYQYKYDKYNRLAEKKLPGKDWEFIVYDKLDRVVATGPVYAPFSDFISDNKKGWMITKYDVFNRVVLTGWMDYTTRKDLQNEHDHATVFNESKIASTTTVENVLFNYTSVVYPTSRYHPLTINYYDDYRYHNAPDTFNVVLDGINQVYYNDSTTPKGLLTGTWVRILRGSNSTDAEISYTLYDNKSRPVRQYSTNYFGGYTYTDTRFDFIGKVLYTLTHHKKDPSSLEYEIKETFEYSEQDRLLTHVHEIVGHTPAELLVFNQYDELGQLIKKNVGGTDLSGSMPFQKVDYTYNIRGWLQTINDIHALGIEEPRDLFAFKINYNQPDNDLDQTIHALYNGNISETHWKTDNDNILRSYGYIYDALNRLNHSIYQKEFVPTNSYDERITYDPNGNILTLNRNGFVDGDTSGMTYPIDDLIYTYDANNKSNRLLSVVDHTSSIDGFKDGHLGGVDYEYDDFGNMIQDRNKGIDKIEYNHLNLPTKIVFNNSGEIHYIYNAVGVKLNKSVYSIIPEEGTVVHKTQYISGFQYLDEELQLFPTAEGYVNVTDGGKFNYVYNYTDHLGNVRLSYAYNDATSGLSILEENHYYPFGLKHNNYNIDRVDFEKDDSGGHFAVLAPVERNKYQYKYNGKEFQDELNLNLYDFGWRNYDPAIGRWMNIDPLAERRYELNPYNYVQNSPLFRIDPNGLTDFTLNKKTGEVKQVGDSNNELDKILQTNSKGEVKKKGEGFLGFLVRKSERGKDKVAVEGIEKNILEDGQNYKTEGVAFEIGGSGNPSQEGIEKFSLQLSSYLGNIEIGGAYASTNGSSVTHMTIGKYEENTRSFIKGGSFATTAIGRLLQHGDYSLMGHFHVHPGGTKASSPDDDRSKKNWMQKFQSQSTMFFILTKSNNSKGYEKTPF